MSPGPITYEMLPLFALRVQAWLDVHSLTITELAGLSEGSPSRTTISRYMNLHSVPEAIPLRRLARAMNLTPLQLRGDEPLPEPVQRQFERLRAQKNSPPPERGTASNPVLNSEDPQTPKEKEGREGLYRLSC